MSASVSSSGGTRRAARVLVVAKTRAPVRRVGLIRRDRLIRRLSVSDDRRVTLVQAPAGYGKSTLLMQWAEADPVRRFAWLTLEPRENDPSALWRYNLFALRALSPGFADGAWALLHRPRPDLDEVVSHVLNSLLDIPGRLVLVLDDYHVITNPECHDSVQYFIDHLPRSMHLALGTRTRPPLSLARIAAGGGLVDVDATALQFTLEETTRALEAVGVHRRPAEVARIHERTEGWPAGVYLSAMADDLHSKNADASLGIDAVHSYLMEQMIDRLEGDERLVLAVWSILRHLNGDLCDRVADRKDSAARLEQLSEANLLLVSLDANGEWYRFHDLLRIALQREFARRPAEQRRIAHLRAMEWWLENDDTAQAIHHGLEAGDYERAAELLCADWFEYMLTGWLETLREWISRFPVDALLAYPPVLVAAAWISAFSGDVKATQRLAAAAREAAYDHPMPDGSASYESAVALLLAGLGLHGMEDANEHAERAYRIEAPGGAWGSMAAALAGLTRFGLGRYDDARIALNEAARATAAEDGVATYARGQLALLEMSVGNWDEGSRQADLACAQIAESNLGNLLSSGAAQVAAAAAAAHFDNRGAALQRLNAIAPIEKVLSDAIPFDAFQIHLVAAETYLVLGDDRAASVHAQTAAARLEAFGDGGIFERRLTMVQRTLCSAGRVVAASEADPLTVRELQVLGMLQTDLSLRDIGSELYVSRNTAKSHVASVYRKLGVTSRTAAIARGRDLGLI